jgi:hypothetical protein
MRLKEKIFPSLAISALFVVTAFVFAPSQVFLTNVREFNASYFELLGYLFLIALPFFLLALILTVFLPRNLATHQKIVALLLSLSLLIWLQGHILVWDYGLLTGGNIEFNTYFLIFDAAVWLAVITIVIIKSAFFYKHVKFISCVLVSVLISTSLITYARTDIPDSNRYEVDRTNEFTFSEEKNVIILVLDAFQSDMFKKIIDDDESYREIFNGFTYFRNSLAGFPSTYASIPNILTGQYYDNSIPFSEFLDKAYYSSSSVLKVLKDQGFEVHFFSNLPNVNADEGVISNSKAKTGIAASTIATLFDAALFRYAPDFLKRSIYRDGQWFLRNWFPDKPNLVNVEIDGANPIFVPRISFDEKALTLSDVAFAQQMMTRSNTIYGKSIFKFYRLNGAHVPYLLNEKLEYEKMGADGYERQAKASLQITKIFFDELKGLGVFDNSMIFVVADHGLMGGAENIQKNAYPLFLAKKFNGMGEMSISDAPVCLSDIPNTIFSELGLMDNVSGKSIFELKDSDSRTRRFLYYNWSVDAVWKDYLPTITEYMVTGHVYTSESWQCSGRKFAPAFAEGPTLQWESGFYTLEGTIEHTWRWCSSEGTLIVSNVENKDRKFLISAEFSTGYPEMSELIIESSLFSESLEINDSRNGFEKEIVVPPGTHTILFSCNARRVNAPADLRHLVFRIDNFEMVEID